MRLLLKIIRAGNGDALLVNFKGTDNNYHNILIDGGNAKAYPTNLKKVLEEIIANKLHEQRIDLAVITHIDVDHIKGIIRLVSDIKNKKIGSDKKNIIGEWWFNSNALIRRDEFWLDSEDTKTGVRDGVTLERYLQEETAWDKQSLIVRPEKYEGNMGTKYIGGAAMTILSPSWKGLKEFREKVENKWNKEPPYRISAREDYKDYDCNIDDLVQRELEKRKKKQEDRDEDEINGSSIAFLFEYNNRRILFLGDAHHGQVVQSLKDLGYSPGHKLAVDYVKLSHHGSRTGTSFDLLELMNCRNFIISTDGINHNLPHKAVFAKILGQSGRDLTQKINFIFNYEEYSYSSNGSLFRNEEQKKYNFDCSFGNCDYGHEIKLIE